ncbi:MAG: BMP family ABC transporter substrate-binding protein [Saccharofermentans sp.]|nr:BMP family ABC transporter substrate-binding protein [Saccharofermentans sp.]
MATAAEEYAKARKLGAKEAQKATNEGEAPNLPALDEIIEKRTLLKEVNVGTREIPLPQVVGTVTVGRQEAFARNFMPLLPVETEFGAKWVRVMDYQTEEGIQEAIKVMEYMGKFYVLEGNKRVSVMKYLEMPTILADVKRLMPTPSETKEYVVYQEFLKFFKCTAIYDILFSEEGSYEKLAIAIGKDLEQAPWDEDTIINLKSAFFNFSKAYKLFDNKIKQLSNADAFLVYIDMYKYESLLEATSDDIKKNLNHIWPEIEIADNGNQITFSEEPQLQKKTIIPIIDNIIKKNTYSEQHPLNVLFLYDGDSTRSRWINGHEEGRKELEEKFPDIVRTLACDLKETEEEFEEAVDAAAADGVELIITTSPVQMEYALRAAVKYPHIKFLNCSIHLSHGAVRTYYGKMYEAKFLLGALAATLADDHRIGYVSTYPICGNVASINAFAIGASMVDPKAKVYLTWSCLKDEYWREYIKENNLKLVSGPDLIRPTRADNAYGLYKTDDNDNITNIAFPEWKWGKYYELIVQTILNDAWNAESDDAKAKAINYWWGMSSGVIDVKFIDENIPYTTKKLIGAMRKAITKDLYNPFDGELRCQDCVIKEADTPRLSNEDIINMNWLADNVIGTIPAFEDLTESAQKTVKANGMPIHNGGCTGEK